MRVKIGEMKIENPEHEYERDHHLIHSCKYHVVFCPKYRRAVLVDRIGERLKELIHGYQADFEYRVIEIEVMPDHVHLLLSNNPRSGILETVGRIKGRSSSDLRDEFPSLKSRLPCLWTRANFIASVGSVSLDIVKRYIEEQKGK